MLTFTAPNKVEASYRSSLFATVNFCACLVRSVANNFCVSGEEQLAVGICVLQPDNIKPVNKKSVKCLLFISTF